MSWVISHKDKRLLISNEIKEDDDNETKKFDKIESGLIAHLGAGIYLNDKEKKIIERSNFIKFSQSLLK